MPVKINGSTSGSVTLAAPATGTDVTVTLPTDLNAKLPIAGGKVLATYSTSTVSQASTSSTSPVDTGLSLTVSMSSATSQALIIVSHAAYIPDSSNNLLLRLLAGATDVMTARAGQDAGANKHHSVVSTFLYSPGTTSAIVYKTQFWSAQTSQLVYLSNAGYRSTFTIMEISA